MRLAAKRCLGVLLVLAYSLQPTASSLLRAQSSNATLSGRVTNLATGQPVANALVYYKNTQNNTQGVKLTNADGLYAFSALQPGTYSVRVDARGFGPQERPAVELTVGGRVEVNVALEATGAIPTPPVPAPATAPSTGPAALTARTALSGFLADIYGPDAQAPQAMLISLPTPITSTLVGDLSTVIDQRKILELPYSGRDVYTLLVLQPGVSSESATGKGLGLAVNGQRVGGTNFLLDGVDNNDLLLTGPSAKVSADAVQEYRMTTSNFSAEFGRATAFIANAITRSGGNAVHGVGFNFFNNERLNANSFASNMVGDPKLPFSVEQYGGAVGGPIRKDHIFYYGSFDQTLSSSRSSEFTAFVPSRTYIARLADNKQAKKLLTQFRAPTGTPVSFYPDAEEVRYHFPLKQRNTQILGRVDYSRAGGRNRLGVRYIFSEATADDFLTSIYSGLNAPLVVRAQNVAVNFTRTLDRGDTNEFRAGYNRGKVGVDRPHPEVPSMLSLDGVTLPGSPAQYTYSFNDAVWQVVDNYTLLRGKHSLILGGEFKLNLSKSDISTARDGLYAFDSLDTFALDIPRSENITVNRFTGRALTDKDYERNYRQKELAVFVQDNWKIARRLTLNLGVRYEYFGVPYRADGPPDWNLFYGPGNNRTERLASATFRQAEPYRSDYNNFGPRFGFAYDLRGNGKTVLRGGYGMAFDRIFNNIWLDVRNNALGYTTLFQPDFKYTFPARDGLPATSPLFGSENTIQVDENLRTPYAQSWFAGVQHQLTSKLLVEANYAGSRGRKLLALDEINRALSNGSAASGRINPKATIISYRGNQGSSNYRSLQISARQQPSHGVSFQVSYTYSRALDNQSDPFRNPAQGAPSASAGSRLGTPLLILNTLPHATFVQQFNSNADWGRSDFDQKHNLVVNLLAESQGWSRAPWLTRGWQVGLLGGFRSGFAFSVLDPDSFFSDFGLLNGNRSELVSGSGESAYRNPPISVTGGKILLDKSKFKSPPANQISRVPRNAFRGPGFFNVDFGLSRNFRPQWLGEQGRIQIRADFFNILNHTNLGNPVYSTGANACSAATPPEEIPSCFGFASYGRAGFASNLPGIAPLGEQPRRIQLGIKVYF